MPPATKRPDPYRSPITPRSNRRLDALIVRTVPGVRKTVKWNVIAGDRCSSIARGLERQNQLDIAARAAVAGRMSRGPFMIVDCRGI